MPLIATAQSNGRPSTPRTNTIISVAYSSFSVDSTAVSSPTSVYPLCSPTRSSSPSRSSVRGDAHSVVLNNPSNELSAAINIINPCPLSYKTPIEPGRTTVDDQQLSLSSKPTRIWAVDGSSDPLDQPLRNPLTPEMKCCIIGALWKSSLDLCGWRHVNGNCNNEMTETYLQHYQQECKMLEITNTTSSPMFSAPSSSTLASKESLVSVTTHRDLVDVIAILSQNRQSTRSAIRQKLAQRFSNASESQNDGSIDLALRVWTMLNVKHPNPKFFVLGDTSISWDQDSLEGFITKLFLMQSNMEDVTFPPGFNLCSMKKIAGIKICWTKNLVDHLQYFPEEKTVQIFHVISFLQGHCGVVVPSPHQGPCCFPVQMRHGSTSATNQSMDNNSYGLMHIGPNSAGIIPQVILQETLDTIGLLFPCWDPNSLKYLRALYMRLEKGTYPLDKHILRLKLNSSNASRAYKYWRPRLLLLHQAFEAAQPSGIVQAWRDDRNKVQWYTFWIAAVVFVITMVFGILGLLLNALQVWLTWKQTMD